MEEHSRGADKEAKNCHGKGIREGAADVDSGPMQQQRTPVAGAMQEQSFWMASFDRAKHHGRPEDYVLAEATNNDRNWGMG